MVKVYDKVVLEKDNEKIEIIKDDFYADNYIGYTIKECKKMIKINNNELEFKSNLERESFLNLLEQSLCVDENNCNIKLYSNWLIKIDFEVIKDFQDGLAIIKENGKYGLINKKMKIIVSCIYNDIYYFGDGLFSVCKNKKYGYVDKTGKEVIPCIYDDAYDFQEGLARVQKDGEIYYIDKTGRKLNKEILIRNCEDILKIPENTRILGTKEIYIFEYNKNIVIFDSKEEREELLSKLSSFSYDNTYTPKVLEKY